MNLTINDLLKHRDTPGHGYFSFRAQYAHLYNNIPEKFRVKEYEEDCDWAIPLFFNFKLLDFPTKRRVLQSILDWNVDVYESTGRTASRRLSYEKNERILFQENKGMYYSVAGYGDWRYDVPKNHVYREVIINLGDDYKSRKTKDSIGILLNKQEDDFLHETRFLTKEFVEAHRYAINEDYYTWDTFTKETGKPRYK